MLTARSLCRVYRSDPGEVARVRRDLAAYLGNLLQADDVILIASELAANSVVHSNSKMFITRCEIFSTCIWIESQDSGADWNPRQPGDRPHGTDLIDLLAEEWGTERGTRGDRITWARVAR
jgi:anti-sigma regulatory factor (Ser/Thr protein kinase)